MDLRGNTRSDVKLCEETEKDSKMNKHLKSIDLKQNEILVSVLSSLGFDKIVNYKVISKV